jgi:hypothetical protein
MPQSRTHLSASEECFTMCSLMLPLRANFGVHIRGLDSARQLPIEVHSHEISRTPQNCWWPMLEVFRELGTVFRSMNNRHASVP